MKFDDGTMSWTRGRDDILRVVKPIRFSIGKMDESRVGIWRENFGDHSDLWSWRMNFGNILFWWTCKLVAWSRSSSLLRVLASIQNSSSWGRDARYSLSHRSCSAVSSSMRRLPSSLSEKKISTVPQCVMLPRNESPFTTFPNRDNASIRLKHGLPSNVPSIMAFLLICATQ